MTWNESPEMTSPVTEFVTCTAVVPTGNPCGTRRLMRRSPVDALRVAIDAAGTTTGAPLVGVKVTVLLEAVGSNPMPLMLRPTPIEAADGAIDERLPALAGHCAANAIATASSAARTPRRPEARRTRAESRAAIRGLYRRGLRFAIRDEKQRRESTRRSEGFDTNISGDGEMLLVLPTASEFSLER